MKKILREPLLHFLVLGAALFAIHAIVSRGDRGEAGRIVITRGQLASMREGFVRTRQRLPTSDEWEGLLRQRVREEVFYREALALGLDRDDAIIRRRLQQKLEFVSEDVVVTAQPTDAELAAYLEAHPEKFRREPAFTFRQLYLSREVRGANLARDAEKLLARLNRPGGDRDFATIGDPVMLDHSFTALPTSGVATRFGREFADTLAGLDPGRWQGPIESSFGVHLVFISGRTDGRMPTLAEVRDAVSREWTDAQRLEANEKFYRDLLKHYTVTIEQPEAVTEPAVTERK